MVNGCLKQLLKQMESEKIRNAQQDFWIALKGQLTDDHKLGVTPVCPVSYCSALGEEWVDRLKHIIDFIQDWVLQPRCDNRARGIGTQFIVKGN